MSSISHAHRLTLLMVCGALCSSVAVVYAVDPEEVELQPESFEEIESELQDVEENLEAAQCGGWNFDMSVGERLGQTIAKVEGVPGREGDPLGHITLGMAKRHEEKLKAYEDDDGFIYPTNTDTVCGFMSACRPKGVVGSSLRSTPDFFEKHPCQRPLDGIREDRGGGGGARDREIDYSCGGGTMRAAEGTFCTELKNRGLTGGLCQKLNDDWVYTLWMRRRDDGNYEMRRGDCRRAADADRPPTDEFRRHSTRYCCTDKPVGNALKNCITCEGTECREGKDLELIPQNRWIQRDAKESSIPFREHHTLRYNSFFRHYMASYERQRVPPVETENPQRRGIPIACYGMWLPDEEFDPKVTRVLPEFFRCTMGVQYERPASPYFNQGFQRMQELQGGKGDYGEDSDYPDPPYGEEFKEELDEEKDLWDKEVANAFSMVNGKLLSTQYGNDLTVPLLSLDSGHQHSTVQRRVELPPSDGGRVRAFDDTVADTNQHRLIVEWWQAQQTQANKLLNPPAIFLQIPPTWSFDLDPLHPLLSGRSREELTEWSQNPLQQPIRLQIQMREDIPGEIAEYLQDSVLLPIEQETIHVVVPMGSPKEFRAIAEGWCDWVKFRNNTPTCEEVGDADIQGVITKLHEYADRIDQTRALRGELNHTMAEYLKLHNKLNVAIGDWVNRNAELYNALQEESERREELKEEWQETMQLYRQFNDVTNMPWCKNDRFTTSIYSLLDPWWPNLEGEDPEERTLTGAVLPVLPEINRLPDLVFDLTHIAALSDTLSIPVIKPIQIRIDPQLLRFPQFFQREPDVPELPDLPEVPSIFEDVADALPEMNVDDFEPLLISEDEDYQELEAVHDGDETFLDHDEYKRAIREIKDLIVDMDNAYKYFWRSLTMDPRDVVDGTEEDCPATGTGRCIHAEFDLIERITRAAARPAVILKEDIESIGEWRDVTKHGIEHCPPEDWVCQFLNPEYTKPRAGSKVLGLPGEKQQELMDDLRSRMIDETVLKKGSDDKHFPYIVKPNDVLPSFDFRKQPNIFHSNDSPSSE